MYFMAVNLHFTGMVKGI